MSNSGSDDRMAGIDNPLGVVPPPPSTEPQSAIRDQTGNSTPVAPDVVVFEPVPSDLQSSVSDKTSTPSPVTVAPVVDIQDAVFRIPQLKTVPAIPVVESPVAQPRKIPRPAVKSGPDFTKGLFARPPNDYRSTNPDSGLISPLHFTPATKRVFVLRHNTQQQYEAAAATTSETRITAWPVNDDAAEDDVPDRMATEADLLGTGGSAKVLRVHFLTGKVVARKTFPKEHENGCKKEVDNLRKLRKLFPDPTIYPAELMGYRVRLDAFFLFYFF